MTNEVARPTRGTGLREPLPQSANVPQLPPELARAVRMTAGDASDRYLPRPGKVLIAQAAALIPAYAAADALASRDVMEGWLSRMALAVVNPPDLDGPKPRLATIIALSGDLPVLCWTKETWQAFLRRGPDARFWPAAADLDGFLRPIADQHRAKLATLRHIAAVGSKPERPDPAPAAGDEVSEVASMTLEEREAVIAAIYAKHGPIRFNTARDEAEAERPPPVQAAPVSPEALQAFRVRCRALVGLLPLPATTTTPEGALNYEQTQASSLASVADVV